MINYVFPITEFMVRSSRWGSGSNFGVDGSLEKVIDLWINITNPPPWP